ncbi:MAG: hypothetical protein K2W95_34305 [Candidatus Obscuribacterales bacterium]|nr:hypothetical protein [Candidatus Obscuribacterales bacterium]
MNLLSKRGTAITISAFMVSAQLVCFANEAASSAKTSGAHTGSGGTTTSPSAPKPLTWQEHTAKARVLLHFTDADMEACEKTPNHYVMYVTSDELTAARNETNQALKLALETIEPLEGLKSEQTFANIMWLITAIGKLQALDAITIAHLFSTYQKTGTNIHQKLSIMHQGLSIGKRCDDLDDLAVALVEKAYGTKGQKLEFSSQLIKEAPDDRLLTLVDGLKLAKAQMHGSVKKLRLEIAKLEKQDMEDTTTSTENIPTPSKLTWQEHLSNGKKQIHSVDESLTRQQKHLKAMVFHPTHEQIGTAREEVVQSLKKAKLSLSPRQGLKSKADFVDVMDLANTAEKLIALDTIMAANLLAEARKSDSNVHHKLALYYQNQHLDNRADEVSTLVDELVLRAFGRKGEKLEFAHHEADETKLEEFREKVERTYFSISSEREKVKTEIAKLQKIEESSAKQTK